jgi:dihydroxyacetone kinase-like protein
MPEAVGPDDLARMFRRAIDAVRRCRDELSRLDSAGGDGDHGTTMTRAMAGVEKVLAEPGPRTPGKILGAIGWSILGVDGGATGPLFGTLFMGMGEAAGDRESLDPAALAGALEAGLAAVGKRTKAKPGDKTLIDALVPAVEAAREAADDGAGVADLLRRAAEAAERGAEATKGMAARFGRAKTLGPKSIGTKDPGATSVSLIVRGFFEGYGANG